LDVLRYFPLFIFFGKNFLLNFFLGKCFRENILSKFTDFKVNLHDYMFMINARTCDGNAECACKGNGV
jgi:hypothetical protein